MSDFERAVTTVLAHEGGLVDDADDPGGATHYGISLRWLAQAGRFDLDGDGSADGDLDGDGEISVEDVRRLTRADAVRLYRLHWWDKHRYGELPPVVGAKLFDLSVNMGPGQAHRLIQRAARACGRALTVDGVLGPISRDVIARLPEGELTAALRSEAAGFYRALIAAKPAFAKYEAGWLNRAYA